MANELRVSISADPSGLSAGLNAAQAQVAATATSMAEAQNIATQAAKNLAEAQLQLGQAALEGNLQAASIIAEYAAAASAAAAAVAQAASATQVETEAVNANVAAKR